MQATLYTIGHSNYAFDDFSALLTAHAIDVVVDVRSNPYARYATHFSGALLKPSLQKVGFKYLFLGGEIGGKPSAQHFYDEDGLVNYDLLAQSESFKLGMDRLQNGINKYRVVAMCAEENPTSCHRRHLIARAAQLRNIEVLHIRKNGLLHSEEDLQSEEAGPALEFQQLKLFNDQNE